MAKQKPRIPTEVLNRLRKKQQNGLYAVALELTNRAKRLATRHTDNGTRRNSITQTREGSSAVLWGIPNNSAPHARHLEVGFTPHWVPARYIGLWMQRNRVGVITAGRNRRIRAVALGLYVGGPGSTLQHAPGGARGYLFGKSGKRELLTWTTRGGESRYLRKFTVGHPILQPTAAELPNLPASIYRRGWERE